MENNSNVVKKMHPHFLGFFGYYFFGALLIISGIISLFYVLILGTVGLVVGIISILMGEMARRVETFYLFDNGVAREYKFMSTSRKFVDYHNIQNMEVNQTFQEKIFRIGNIKFDTAGSEKVETLSFRKIKDPYEVERMVQERMRH